MEVKITTEGKETIAALSQKAGVDADSIVRKLTDLILSHKA